MRRFAIARWSSTLVLAAILSSCSESDTPSAVSHPAERGAKTSVATAKRGAKATVQTAGFAADGADQGPTSTTQTTPFGAAGLLERVPADAWLVVRLPTFRSADDAWRTSALVQGLERAGLDEAALAVVDPLDAAIRAASTVAPADVKPWLVALKQLRGDAVLALLSIDPAASTGSNEPPARLLAMISLGEAAGEIARLIDSAVRKLPRGSTCERLGAGHYRLDDANDHAELWLRDGRLEFLLGIGCEPGQIDDVLAASATQSFATCAAYTAAHAAAGTQWLEIYANAQPMTALLETIAPSQVRESMKTMGLDALIGMNASFTLDGALMRNTFAMLTRDRSNIVSACLGDGALDRGFARLVPDDAESASMFALDLETAMAAIRGHLPTAAKPEFDTTLAQFEDATGLDLHDALLSNFGPNVVFASRGSMVAAMTGADEYEASIAVQVRNQPAAEALLGMLLEKNRAAVKPRANGDLHYVSFGIPIPELAWLDASIGISNGLLVLATSGAALERVFDNAKSQEVHCAPLAAALAATPGDAFFVSTSDTRAEIDGLLGMMRTGSLGSMREVAELPFDLPTAEQVTAFCVGMPPSTSTMRATATGLVYESAGPVNMPWSGAPSLAIIASIAIPKLMSARISANEAAAIATLHNTMSAQAQFKSACAKDRDGDGAGEYGTFGELTGKITLPNGTKLNPPLLSSSFGNVEHGAIVRSGYIFAAILPGPNAQPLPEVDQGGAGPNVDPNLAETLFTVYAWPVEAGRTGARMFAIDQGGTVYAARCASFDPPCSGMDSPPPLTDVFDFDARDAASHEGAVADFVWKPAY